MRTEMLLAAALRRITRYKLRSIAMMTGVMVGAFTLTAAIALGSGLKEVVLNYFSKTFMPNSINLTVDRSVPGARELRESDIDAIIAGINEIVAWSPLIPGGRRNITRAGREDFITLNGVSAEAQIVIGQPAVSGEYFNEQDVQLRLREALIGQTVVEQLFPDQSPLGESLTIDNLVFTVKGTLKELGGDPHGGDLDNIIAIPYTTLLQMNKSDQLFNVRFLVAAGSDSSAIAASMREIMRRQHNIDNGQRDDFQITTAPSGQAAFRQFEATFKILLPLVVGIIFLIAAGVISIISLSSIHDRIPEIGLRKAVGARDRDIRAQIFLESATLSAIGGLVGILLTLPFLMYLQNIYARLGGDVHMLPSIGLVAICLICCAMVGLLAGVLPARRAAALAPVEAIR